MVDPLDMFGLPADEWRWWDGEPAQETGMQSVKLNKDDVLKRVRENREKHRAIFEEALENYQQAVIDALEAQIERARKGQKINQHLGLIEPEDHTRDYDTVIDMLELSVEDEITLSTGHFQQYMRDEWPWQQQFLLSNSHYSGTARTEAASRGYTP